MSPGSPERSARESELFAWFNRHRDDPGPDPLGAFLADPELRVGWRDLASLGGHWNFSSYVRSPHVAEFFVAYAKLMKPRRILDPCFFSPIVAAALAEELPDVEVVAVSPFVNSVRYGKLLSAAVDWRQQDPVAALDEADEDWDLIVGSPAIGLRQEVAEPSGVASSLSPRAWRQEVAHLVIAAAAGRLAAGGKIAMLLGEGSIFNRAGRELEEWLAARGLYLEASISVLGGLPAAAADTQISVFGQDARDDLFIARLGPGGPIAEVVANLDARSIGDAPELGMRTDRQRYHGWRAAMARIGLEEALADSPSVSTLGKVSLSIRTLLLRQADPSPDFENAIYLPGAGEGPVRTRVDRGGKAKTRSVVAVRLDPKQVDAEYLVHWLNGPGRLSRQSVMVGTLPRALPAALHELLIPLPPLELQIRTVEMRRQVAGLSTELDALTARISGSFSVAELQGAEDEFRQLLAGDDLDAWADRLPFPVASVLIRYLAEADPRRQLDHLLDFFEGFASFCATLLLSAARSDPARWEGLKGKIGRSGPGRTVPLLRPTFGAWVGVGRTVVKALEGELAAADDDVRSSVLNVSDQAFAAALAGRDLWDLLDRARAIRNRQSHGGNVSITQMEARLRELQELLGELHRHHGSAFDRVELIEPRESVYERRSYRFPRVRRLRGASSVFKEGEVISVGPLAHNSLYLADKRHRLELALEVIPLFRLLPIPDSEDSACFFLNGVGADGRFDFVSLHFTGRPLDPLVDPALTELVAELSGEAAGR